MRVSVLIDIVMNGQRKTPAGLTGRGLICVSAFSGETGRFLVSILLDTCGPETGETMLIDRGLPAKKFLHRQGITLTCFLKAEKPTAYSGDNFSLTANDPAPCSGGREVRDGQWTAIRTDNIFYTRSCQIGHCTLYTTLKDLIETETNATALRIT
ncbi:hypothetical protein A8A54_07500 [Brucella pseudogrignonensis]|jgi:hypothetical protein|nr:hypothetical protein A8A54_07500 [Brucella pseudogrignonensis]